MPAMDMVFAAIGAVCGECALGAGMGWKDGGGGVGPGRVAVGVVGDGGGRWGGHWSGLMQGV